MAIIEHKIQDDYPLVEPNKLGFFISRASFRFSENDIHRTVLYLPKIYIQTTMQAGKGSNVLKRRSEQGPNNPLSAVPIGTSG
ncbi:hypothetical protein FHS18_006840 [Paenibacillus phyllosphaerae]|uniref:Uncharacterized protein n=1 Tax=Paenibacillus phyllosphaerae TaxID=274593 RepID=A0A7W5B5E3_9BACL|nr:hypothetical protein [Paenibacillus phyllosphaerae]